MYYVCLHPMGLAWRVANSWALAHRYHWALEDKRCLGLSGSGTAVLEKTKAQRSLRRADVDSGPILLSWPWASQLPSLCLSFPICTVTASWDCYENDDGRVDSRLCRSSPLINNGCPNADWSSLNTFLISHNVLKVFEGIYWFLFMFVFPSIVLGTHLLTNIF